MSEIGYAALGIIPSFDGFQGKLEQGTAKHMVAAGTSGGSKFGNAAGESAGKRFGLSFKKVATGLLTGYAAIKVKDFLGDSIAEARESQKVGAITTQVIKSTGAAAKVTADQVGDLSGALSTKTGIDDEVIQRGANMLLTFKDIRNETGKGNKIFSRSTKVITDMAAAMAGGKGGDLDLKASAIQVGKALNDPVKGVTALAKVGVSFTNQQRAQIKALVEGGDANAAVAVGLISSTTEFSDRLKQNDGDVLKTVDTLTNKLNPAQKKTYEMYAAGGHTLEAQKRILQELNSEFGGTAAAQATAGEKVAVAWGNIKEGIGTALLPMVDDLENAFLKKGIPAAQKFTDWLQKDGVPALRDFGDEARPLAHSILPAIGDALNVAKDAAVVMAPKLKAVFDGFNKLPDWVKTTVVLGAGSAALAKKLGAGSLLGSKGGLGGGSGLLGAISKTKPVPVFVVNEGIGGDGAAGGKKGWLKVLAGWGARGLGPTAVTGAGITAAGKAVGKDKVAFAPGVAGDAGDGGMTLPAGALDFSDDVKKTSRAIIGQHDAWLKVRGDIDRGKSGAENLVDQVFTLGRAVGELPDKKTTHYEALGLVDALSRAYQLRSIYAGLDRDVTTSIITNHINKFTRMTGSVEGVGATGGIVRRPTVALIGEAGPEAVVPLNRTPGNGPLPAGIGGVSVHIDQVVAHDYGDFMLQTQARARRASLDHIGRPAR